MSKLLYEKLFTEPISENPLHVCKSISLGLPNVILIKFDSDKMSFVNVFKFSNCCSLNVFINEETNGRVRVAQVEFMEHGKNSALYKG